MSRQTTEFVIYIINELASITGRPTSHIYNVLERTECINGYLVPMYDVLHTMSSQSVAEDVKEYVKSRGAEL